MNNKEHSKQPENLSDEFLIDEPEEETQGKNKKRKLSGKGIAILIVLAVLLLAIIFGGVYAAFDYFGGGPGRDSEYVVNIESGSTTAQITSTLKQSGTIKIPILFRVYSRFKGYDKYYKSGDHVFTDQMGYSAIAKELMKNIDTVPQAKVTIPEGKNIDEIAQILEDKGVCSKEDFLFEVREGEFDYDFIADIPTDEVYYRLEGYLFPDTYNFYYQDSKECAHLAVDRMLSQFNEKIKPYKEQIENSGYTLHEILTLASLIELESSGVPGEMPNVSAVFHNRLNHPEKGFATLGSSPTRDYPYYRERYNTDPRNDEEYVKGLPAGPICSPGIVSVASALNPTENFDYYFFVTDAANKFYYNKTMKQHEATIKKLKEEKNWIYDN